MGPSGPLYWTRTADPAQFIGKYLSTVLKYGGAAVLVLSALLVSRGLAASAPTRGDILVNAVKADAAAPARPPPTDAEPLTARPLPATSGPATADDPVIATRSLDGMHFQPVLSDTLSPEALKRLVALHTARPEPMRPAVECLARTVYHEAANQALWGQLAVAQVVVNRTRSGAFPTSVCDVVSQPGQFSQGPVGLSATLGRPWGAAVAIATIAQAREFPQIAPGALFFHAAWMRPSWSGTHERIAQIGDHIFYR